MYQRILVPLDGSATAERGLRHALGLAADNKAWLLLLHVVEDFPMPRGASACAGYQEVMAALRQSGLDLLAKAKLAAVNAGVQTDIFLRDAEGERVAAIVVQEAQLLGCDLIVMGTHGRRGYSRLTMGSDAETVVRTSPVPVLLVRNA